MAQNRRLVGYEVTVTLTVEQKAQLKAKATAEMRPLSGYVGKLIVEELGRE